jgi:PAT family beta-lactamase induction signal transducer AmpG
MSSSPATWRDSLRSLADVRVLRIGCLGFSSGLPLLLVFGTLSFWLAEADIDRSTIGFISWVALAYAVKVLWSPLVDQLEIPIIGSRLGRRRSWLLLSQLTVMGGLVGMGVTDPKIELEQMVICAVIVAFASATQDIVVDAYRIESAATRLQGIMAGVYTTGYRLAMFASSAGALALAAWLDSDEGSYQAAPWQTTYFVMAGLMLVGLLTTAFSPEPPSRNIEADRMSRDWLSWLQSAVVAPFQDFVKRYGVLAILLLMIIATYRISDIVMGVIANVFYKDIGFTKDQIAVVVKTFGVAATVAGGLAGGVAVYRFGVMKMMVVGGVLASGTNLVFSFLASQGPDLGILVVAVGCDTFSAGVASSAFIAYLSSLTNVSFSATQYALFSSIMLLLPKFIGGFSGVIVEHVGYERFFVITAAMGIPVVLLLLWSARVFGDVRLEKPASSDT